MPAFYLLEGGAFNFSSPMQALDVRLGGQPVDSVLPLSKAQYLVDLPLLKALRSSPMRARSRSSAEAFVVGSLPFASAVLGDLEDQEQGRLSHDGAQGKQRHFRRMHDLAHELMAEPCFHVHGNATVPVPDDCYAPAARGAKRRKPVLLIAPGILLRDMLGGKLEAALATVWRPGPRQQEQHVVLASCDPGFVDIGTNLRSEARYLLGSALTLPHYPHGHARLGPPEAAEATADRTGVLFHGGTGRHDQGVRARMLTALHALATDNATPVDLRIAEMSRGVSLPASGKETTRGATARAAFDSYRASGHAYRNRAICMAPQGDNLSSRRLFDALSAGCVPVLVRSGFLLALNNYTFASALPFPNYIDWPAITLQMVSKVGAACPATDARWLASWHQDHVRTSALADRRRLGQAAFHAHLDIDKNPMGVAHTLLLQLMTRHHPSNPVCQLTSRRSRKNKDWHTFVDWVCRGRFPNETWDGRVEV